VVRVTLFRKDFKILARLRAGDARILASHGHQQGAYYLAGYAIECALKACIAKKTRRSEFPPHPLELRNIYTHDLNVLLKTAGLEKQLEKDMKSNPKLAANWNTVKDWNQDSRYSSAGLNGSDLHKAITGGNGVLSWIRKHW
jgi:hypothetical protein